MNEMLLESAPFVPGPAAKAATPRRDAGWRWLVAANFLALLVAAVLLRGWQLGSIPELDANENWLRVQAERLASGEAIAWRTPTGHPVNPFLLLPVALLHLLFSPSAVVLRAMAVISGVAALAANFWLCRRIFDRRTALVSTAVLAVLPIAIAYSRLAWDASQTLLATVLMLYFALATVDRHIPPPAGKSGKYRKWPPADSVAPDWLPALLAFGAAIWVDPTNVFALWLLVVPAVYRYGHEWRPAGLAAWERTRAMRGRLPLRLAGLATLGIVSATAAWFCRGLLGTVAWRLFDPQQSGLFVRRLVRLFSGGTMLELNPGAAQASAAMSAADLAFVSLAAVAALGLVQRLRQNDSARERCLAWAAALMVGSFYLVAGPGALAPQFQRYGMCLIAPVGVLLALGWSHWLGSRGLKKSGLKQVSPGSRGPTTRHSARSRWAAVMLAAMAWLWLAHFYRDYFLVLPARGGESHVAARTAAVEPKLRARTAVAAGRPTSSTTIRDFSAAGRASQTEWFDIACK